MLKKKTNLAYDENKIQTTGVQKNSSRNTEIVFSETVSGIIDENGILTVSGTGSTGEWSTSNPPVEWEIKDSIVEIVIHEGITNIGEATFYGCYSVTTITFPSTLKTIGKDAFPAMYGVQEITFNDGLESIGEQAFRLCRGLQTIILPSSLKSIGDRAFEYCGMKDVILNEGLTHVGIEAFRMCSNALSVTIPSTIEEIGNFAFSNNYGLTSLTIKEGARFTGASVFESCDRISSLEIPSSLEAVPVRTFYGCRGITFLKINDGVKRLEEKSLNGLSALKTLIIPDSVTYLGKECCGFCFGLETLELGNGVTESGTNPFISSTSFKKLILKDGMEFIGDFWFERTFNLKNVQLPETLTSIGNSAFSSSSLEEIIIPKNVTNIGDNCFNSPFLRRVTSYSVKPQTLGTNCFGNPTTESQVYGFSQNTTFKNYFTGVYWKWNELTPVDLGMDIMGVLNQNTGFLELLGSGATYDWTESNYPLRDFSHIVKEIAIGKNITSLGDYCFFNLKNIEKIIFTENIRKIGRFTFARCSNIERLDLPSNVEEIADFCFKDCKKIKTITNENNSTQIVGKYAFDFVPDFLPISVQGDSSNKNFKASVASKARFKWVETKFIPFSQNITALFDVETGTLNIVGNGIMSNFSAEISPLTNIKDSIKKIIIDDRIATIGNYAFCSCSNLEEIVFSNSLTAIGDYSFSGCEKITNINLPDSLTSLGVYCFENLNSITHVELKENIVKISDGCFSGCNALLSITNKKQHIQTIGLNAFSFTPLSQQVQIYGMDSNLNFKNLFIDSPEIYTWHSLLIEKKLGDNVTAYINPISYDIIIEGTGDMYNYDVFSRPLDLFSNYTTSVEIKEGITSVSDYCFYSFGKLTNLSLPLSLKRIGEATFSGCSVLKEVDIMENVIEIHYNAFAYCRKLKTITNYGFSGQYINPRAFLLGTEVAPVTLCGRDFNKAFKELSNDTTTYTWSELVVETETEISLGDNIKALVSPKINTINIYGSGKMDNWTLETSPLKDYRTQTKTIIISDTVESIGSYCFYGFSELQTITISKSISEIGDYAFAECTKVEQIFNESYVNQILATHAFDVNSTSAVTAFCYPINKNFIDLISNKPSFVYKTLVVTKPIGENVFYTIDKSLGLMTIYGKGTTIDNSNYIAVEGLKPWSKFTKKVVIEEGVEDIGIWLFDTFTELEEVFLPNSLKRIGEVAFARCEKLRKIHNTEHVEIVEEYAFRFCKNLIPPNFKSITTLGGNCFEGCLNFKNFFIYDNVKEIQSNVFYNCSGLKYIVNYCKTPQVVSAKAFESVGGVSPFPICGYSSNSTLKESVSDISKYKWCEIVEIELGVNIKGLWVKDVGHLDVIGFGIMYNWTPETHPLKDDLLSIKTVTIDKKISNLGDYFLYGCNNIETIKNSSEFEQEIGINSLNFTPSLSQVDIYGCSTNLGFKKIFSNQPVFSWIEISLNSLKEEIKDIVLNKIGFENFRYALSEKLITDSMLENEIFIIEDIIDVIDNISCSTPIVPQLRIYNLNDYGVTEGVIVVAEVLQGQTYYANKTTTVKAISLTTTPTVATSKIEILSTDCVGLENVVLFVK